MHNILTWCMRVHHDDSMYKIIPSTKSESPQKVILSPSSFSMDDADLDFTSLEIERNKCTRVTLQQKLRKKQSQCRHIVKNRLHRLKDTIVLLMIYIVVI
mmetsp:Transcript_31560/g.47093  ORF Transcript_31560/g.47093 Transcript_31560/m.47093 type:complete len:100 (-) Transcript_31560:18-317(-)